MIGIVNSGPQSVLESHPPEQGLEAGVGTERGEPGFDEKISHRAP